jgi:two-component system, chemotaxis family, CheB/CheR fusion protein
MAARKKGKRTARNRPSRTRRRRAVQAAADTPVVGIGASAGALEALRSLFGAVPAKTGLGFVVVLHLDPTHTSFLPELLAKATPLVVEPARDRQVVEADHVYVVPPNRSLTVDARGVIRVRPPDGRAPPHRTVDVFLCSLALLRDRAIGVVLSGAGTDGTLGARAIKAAGGLVIAQAPESATHPGMPSSAIASGVVDQVLAPDQMAHALLDYARGDRFVQVRPSASTGDEAPAVLQPILAALRVHKKDDFRGYEKRRLRRRIERRMKLAQIATLPKYAEYLRSNPAEVDALHADLMVGVTPFFRDPAAFEELGTRVLPELMKRHDRDTPIRVWVPGCATGEEAYSIAIALAEQLAAAKSSRRIQIFATDRDERALELARAASYPENIALDVSPDRLQRFFTHQEHRYTIVKAVRESVIFARHDLIGDPPLSRMDLVSCRNVLTWLDAEARQKSMSQLHFSLSPGGYLFFGDAEGREALEGLFEPVSRRRRFFKALPPPNRRSRDARARPLARKPRARVADAIGAAADRALLARLAPSAVVVRGDGQIVRLYGPMHRYLERLDGRATFDLVALARDSLKPTLRAALHEATGRKRRTVLEAPLWKRGRTRTTLRIGVEPLDAGADQEHWLVVFDERPAPASALGRALPKSRARHAERLEAELHALSHQHHELTRELERSNEELRDANEEMLSMNEELRVSNEEMVTAKEELQSMNEEMTTLNAELEDRVQELIAVNDDLANLLSSTDIGTVLLDTELRIKRFTAAAADVLNLQPSDVGRPMNHIAGKLVGMDLDHEARAVLHGPATFEKEVDSRDGKSFFVRGQPYRAGDRSVQGVVLTLVEVTALKRTERELRKVQEELRHWNQALEQRVSERTKQVTLMHEVTRAIGESSSWDEALQRVVREICRTGSWQIANVYLPDPKQPDKVASAISSIGHERFAAFQAQSERLRFGRGDSLPGRVYAERKPIWASSAAELQALLSMRAELALRLGLQSAVALPVSLGNEVVAVLELVSDEPHAPSEEISTLMSDVSAQIATVFERERSTSQIAELVWREQQALLHTLHDALGQTLTGLGMLGAGLSQHLAHGDVAGAADAARQISEESRKVLEQVRSLARGLFPMTVEPEALLSALRELAATTQSIYGVRVRVEVDAWSSTLEGSVATQLYRIAQEAVTNAVKHGRPRNIEIILRGETPAMLSIRDDGLGMQNANPNTNGMGLRIMRHRAASIGGRLTIEPSGGSGTVVTCTMRPAILATRRT